MKKKSEVVKKEKESEFTGKEFWEIVETYIDALHLESGLYKSELKRSLERYKESKKEPIFYINGKLVALEDIPLRVYLVMFEAEHVDLRTRMNLGGSTSHLKNAILKVEYYLRSLPEARIPVRPEMIDKWMRSSE